MNTSLSKKHWVGVLHLAEEGKSSKTGEYDESVILDDAQLWPVYKLLGQWKKKFSPRESVIGMDERRFGTLFKKAGENLRLQVLGPVVPYQLRHTAASNDRAEDRRPLMEVKKKGRWLADKSVHRYEKGGRVREQMSKLPSAMQDHCMKCQQHFGEILLGRRPPFTPPTPPH